MANSLEEILAEARACTFCAEHLPLGPRPVVRAGVTSRLVIIGQAPGTRVHETGVPWDDPSGDRLRDWMAVRSEIFYDHRRIAIVPMGFCYPDRRGMGGDLPPRPECAPAWHPRILAALPDRRLSWRTLETKSARRRSFGGLKNTATEPVGDPTLWNMASQCVQKWAKVGRFLGICRGIIWRCRRPHELKGGKCV